MDLWKSLAGMVEAELTSAEPESALAAAAEQNIAVFSVQRKGELTLRFRILRRDYHALEMLAQRRGERLCLRERRGIYWVVKKALSRPLLLTGMIMLISLALFIPTRILFVRVEGNEKVPDNKILAAAEENGICFFVSRQDVRSEKIKNALLSAVPELQWAGVNTSGCVATISVRERSDSLEQEKQETLGSLVASRDGFIISCTATKGNILCRPGQAVKAGQVLISGYTDCGICIRATGAEGEIYAQTFRNVNAVTPLEWEFRTDSVSTRKSYSLLIGKKRINLWKDSGISDTSCGRMYEEYYITLPGGFQLPLAVVVEEYICFDTELAELSSENFDLLLRDFAESYLRSQMVAGEILSSEEVVFEDRGVFRLEGQYVCSEMIGRVKQEQIGEYNGENS